MSWKLTPLVELPFFEIVPYPQDWRDPAQREQWHRGRAGALGIPYEDIVEGGHVRASQLSVEAWRAILTSNSGDAIANSEQEDDTVRIDGGLGLFLDDTAVLVPQCCTWVADAMDEWRRFIEEPPDYWTMLYIGHPWAFVKRSGNVLTITEPTESSNGNGLPVVAEVPFDELTSALEYATVDAEKSIKNLSAAIGRRPSDDVVRNALGLDRSALNSTFGSVPDATQPDRDEWRSD